MATIFQMIGQSFDNATATFVTSTSARLIADLTPIAIAGVGLYLTIYGYMILLGKVQEPFRDFMLKCVKIILIAGFALNAPTYTYAVVNTLNGLQTGLVAAISNSPGDASVYQALDQLLDRIETLLLDCVERASNESSLEIGAILGWYLCALLVAVGGFVVVVPGGAIVVLSLLLLKVMFAIGPLFIMCLLWPVTARFFDGWFGQVMTYTLKIAIAVTIISFAVAIFDRILGAVNLDGDSNALQMSVELAVSGVLLYMVIREVNGIAAALGGGVAAAAMSLGSLAAAAVAPLMVVQRSAQRLRDAVDPVSTRRDMSSGMMSSARRSEHLASGNTMLNPAYRQRLVENFGRNWGKRTGGGARRG